MKNKFFDAVRGSLHDVFQCTFELTEGVEPIVERYLTKQVVGLF
nr:hypothetical protein [Lacticigenium naphthae]